MKFQSGGRKHRTQARSNRDIVLKRSDVKDWDDEELQYGRRRDKNGNLCGRPPSFIPKACHDELMRRHRSRVEYMLAQDLPEVVRELIAIAKGDSDAKQDQVRAMNMVMERAMGKVVEHVQMTVEQPWRDALDMAIVGTEEQAAEVIDVEPEPSEEDVEWE